MNQIQRFDHDLVKMKREYRQVLPAHMTEDRLGRMVRNVVSRAQRGNGDNPLLDADRTSFWSAVMTVASLGLECDGILGQAYLIPFKGKVAPVPGYGGYITLAWNSGITLQGVLVYENDHFRYQRGTNPLIDHLPSQQGEPRGALHAAYACAFSKVGTVFDVSEHADIKRIRDMSAGYKYAVAKNKLHDSPWHTHFDVMAKKCPIRALGKNLPLSVQRAAVLDDFHDRGGAAYIRPDGEVETVEPIELNPE